MLADKPLRDLVAAFASNDPTPGGGSASSLASAVGAALLMMVATLPKSRSNAEEDRIALQGAVAALAPLREQLVDSIDADASAYDRVVAAYRLPKASADEQQARKYSIQQALKGATDVPLRVMRLSVEALTHAAVVAGHGHRAASSDIGVAAILLRAGATGARLNVEVNLGSIEDTAYGDAVRSEVASLMTGVTRSVEAVEAELARI